MTLPPSGRSAPATQLRKTVFPAPLGPRRPKISPFSTASETPLTATSPPNRLTRRCVSRIATGSARPASLRRLEHRCLLGRREHDERLAAEVLDHGEDERIGSDHGIGDALRGE